MLGSLPMGRTKLPASQRRTVALNVRCEPWLKHELDELARKQERTLAQVARAALKDYIERQTKARAE
jgi:predicted transcriptional regulator